MLNFSLKARNFHKIVFYYHSIFSYFLHPHEFGTNNWEEDEKFAFQPSTAVQLMAYNGWLINADPLVNFAEWPSQVYLRRELVGDILLSYPNDIQSRCAGAIAWNWTTERVLSIVPSCGNTCVLTRRKVLKCFTASASITVTAHRFMLPK